MQRKITKKLLKEITKFSSGLYMDIGDKCYSKVDFESILIHEDRICIAGTKLCFDITITFKDGNFTKLTLYLTVSDRDYSKTGLRFAQLERERTYHLDGAFPKYIER